MTAALTGRRAFVRISQHPLPVSAFTAHEEANIFSENDINRETGTVRWLGQRAERPGENFFGESL